MSSEPWFKMLGDTLLTAEGPKPTEEVVKGKRKVALLFADVNCPYCEAFEPVLQDTIKKVKAADPLDTEVVYIPAEVQAESFRGVTTQDAERPQLFASMPWETSQGSGGKAGLGFARKKAVQEGRPQGALGEKFGVKSLPKLIVLDGKNGRKLLDGDNFVVETEDSAKNVIFSFNDDLAPETWVAAKNFSWSGMLGPSLQTLDGLKPTEDVLKGKKQVALFFADIKCPFCSAFEPNLQATIQNLKAKDPSDTEVVYIPAEVQAESFRGATNDGTPQPFPCMPWETSQGSDGKPGLGFVRKKGREQFGRVQGALGERFGIGAVPRLYVCDAISGKVQYEGEKFIVEKEEGDVISMTFDAEEVPPSWKESLPKTAVA
eukprot:CAMPEP_0172791884 /NCGR_PEP_ID=MMETSP1074-20121228/208695_1 /TAXON_ID=2916 /ORGANISM="Ceratium fusus, Strain PA161109" /LENGTH=374 /DNA_ID=CAMNT_0013628947 /DNA_START=26 /DNA_END=1150 /DNA_ORIENTATION=+